MHNDATIATCRICNKTLSGKQRWYCSRECARHAPSCVRKRDGQGRFLCYGCQQWLPREAFHACTRNKTAGIHSRCKVCQEAQRIRWKSVPNTSLRELQRKAGKRGRDYSLPDGWAREQFDRQSGQCFYTDITMTFDHGSGRVWSNVSIDRIDSHGPYSPENCVLCCTGFNLMKTNLSLDALDTLCRAFIAKRDTS